MNIYVVDCNAENIKKLAGSVGIELTHEQAEVTAEILLLMQEAYEEGKVEGVKEVSLYNIQMMTDEQRNELAKGKAV